MEPLCQVCVQAKQTRMEPLLVKPMSHEACFVYPYQTFAIKLLIIFATIVNPMCGIHVFVMLILVACRD